MHYYYFVRLNSNKNIRWNLNKENIDVHVVVVIYLLTVGCRYYCSHYRPHSPWCQSTLPCPPQSWCWSAAGAAYVWCQAWLGLGGEGPTGATKYQRRSLSHHDLPLWPH